MNVLVAMDGSKYGQWGLKWAAALPLLQRPHVTALHVVDAGALRAPFMVQPVIAGSERFIREEIKRMETRADETVTEARGLLASLNLTGKAKQERGAVAPTLLKRAPKKNGLLVVGSRGLDALDRFMLGSVSTNLIHHASCPVLVVKTDAEPLRRVVLAVDGSASSRKALSFFVKHMRPAAGREPIRVTVAHVMPFLQYPELKEAGTRLVDEDVKKLVKAGFAAEAVCQLGKPADQIIKVASHRKAQLIVMGAKGLGAVARFLLGSVSSRIAHHAGCSVLVIR